MQFLNQAYAPEWLLLAAVWYDGFGAGLGRFVRCGVSCLGFARAQDLRYLGDGEVVKSVETLEVVLSGRRICVLT